MIFLVCCGPSGLRWAAPSMVGVVGLEPTTSASRTPRASQLRYTPTVRLLAYPKKEVLTIQENLPSFLLPTLRPLRFRSVL